MLRRGRPRLLELYGAEGRKRRLKIWRRSLREAVGGRV